MARDVEFNVTASDKTGSALASAERKFKASQKKVEDENKRHSAKLGDVLGKGLADGVEKFAPKLAASLGKSLTAVSDFAGPALAAGIAIASPVIAATVSAAITAGVGVGVAGIGVALVSQDARVAAAGAQLGKTLMSSLQQDASPFIAPVLKGIDKIAANFETLRPKIQNIFRNSSKFVDPLVDGANKAVDGIVDGIDKLVAKSGPAIDALGDSIGRFGDGIGDFLAGVDTENAAHAISDLTTNLLNLLGGIGLITNALSKVYGFFRQAFSDDDTKLVAHTAGAVDDLGLSFQGTSEDAYDYAAGLKEAEAAVQGLYSANRTLYSSTTNVAQAFSDATKAAKDNGATLSTLTQKGRDNRDALSKVATALQSNYDAYVKVNGAGAGASALASTLRGKFVTLAEKMGASKTAANKLADSLLGIPNVNRKVSIATQQAKDAADDLKRKLASIKDRSVYVKVAFNEGRINKVQNQLARLGSTAFDANDSFGLVDRSAGDTARTGGPAQPVQVNQALTVNLDGTPFRRYAAREIQASNDRQAWRQRVGTK